jgi:hypothetical protein
MGKLTERYPGIRRVQSTTTDANPPLESLVELIQPYLDWQLVEIDTVTSDILIQRPAQQRGQSGPLDDLLVLVGPVAAAWLRFRPEAKR